jgi:thymidylate kinase
MGCISFAHDFFWPKPKAKVYYIEGNVGAGKTETMLELAELLRERGNTVSCLQQQERQWADKGLLADMSSDHGLQLFAAYGPLRDHVYRADYIATHSINFDVILVERHPTTTVDVFNDSEESNKLFAAVDAISGFMHIPLHTIYLKNTPAVCYARMTRRGRHEDKLLDEVMLQDFDHKHDEMLTKRQALGGNVYVSDALGADSHHHLITSIASSIGFNIKTPPVM